MPVVFPRAVPVVAALVACAVAVPSARARGDGLVGQIAQAAPTSSPEAQPPLTQDPPVPLGTPTPTPTPTASPTATPRATVRRGERLPDTGPDAGLVALAGLSLLGMGVSLRAAALDGPPR